MLEVGRIVPVYESLGGTTAWGAKLTSRWLRRVMWGLFEELGASAGEERAGRRRCRRRMLRAAGIAGAIGRRCGRCIFRRRERRWRS